MEPLFAIVIGLLVAAAAYLFLARDLPRALIGFVLLGTGANLSILAAGRIGSMTPPLVASGGGALAETAANPLPQALILTAIVVGVATLALGLALVVRINESYGTIEEDEIMSVVDREDNA